MHHHTIFITKSSTVQKILSGQTVIQSFHKILKLRMIFVAKALVQNNRNRHISIKMSLHCDLDHEDNDPNVPNDTDS